MEASKRTMTKLKQNISNITSGLEVFRVGNWGPDQVNSPRENVFQDRERSSCARHPGVMLGHFPNLPPYVLRQILLRTTQQPQSIRQTHPETMGVSPSKSLASTRYPRRRILIAEPAKGLELTSLLRSDALKKTSGGKRTFSKSHTER